MSKTVTITLTDFLLARISEDEAVARRGQSPPAYDHYGDSAWEESYKMADAEGCSEEGVAFIEHMSPARVLAECEAKRRIVEEHGGGADPCDAHDASFETIPCDTLRALASVYADHPDYQESWRV